MCAQRKLPASTQLGLPSDDLSKSAVPLQRPVTSNLAHWETAAGHAKALVQDYPILCVLCVHVAPTRGFVI